MFFRMSNLSSCFGDWDSGKFFISFFLNYDSLMIRCVFCLLPCPYLFCLLAENF